MKKNILVVDDSALMRRMLCDIINSDERFHVMNKAIDGVEALDLLRLYDYDAMVLDVNMPRMDGIQLLREMQKYSIKTKVMMSSTDTKAGAQVTLDALELGALDFIHKPNNAAACRSGEFKDEFLRILAAVTGSKNPVINKSVIDKSKKTSQMVAELARKNRLGKSPSDTLSQPLEPVTNASSASSRTGTMAKSGTSFDAMKLGNKKDMERLSMLAGKGKKKEAPKPAPSPSQADGTAGGGRMPSFAGSNKIVAIASSTGGPKALQPVLTSLPKDLSCPVVLVQHMPKGFTKSLAERLDTICEVSVKEAREGESLFAGSVYIARGGSHMNVDMKGGNYVIRYSDEPAREGVKPCANYMYESLRNSGFDEIVCVVMTGMGADGTEGILNLKKSKKVHVIVQDKDTCAVYGMPKSVVSAGIADQVLPLTQIAQEIIMSVGVK